MPSDIFWFLPTSGDTRYLGRSTAGRPVTPEYISQIAVAADSLGYDGLLIPTGSGCLDPWITATAVATSTRRIKLLVALRTSVDSPTAAARMTATLDRVSHGRLLLNVVPGGDAAELAGDGVFLDHDARYESAGEFLEIWQRLLRGENVTFKGRHQHVVNARNLFPAVQRPHPPLYFGGSSPAAHALAGRYVDDYLTWGEPPSAVAEKIADVRREAQRHGRTIRFGVRLHVIVRETSDEAWKAADRLIANLDDDTIRKVQSRFATMDSVGQRRMTELHGGSRDHLEVSPNLWAGIGLARGGAGTALVGDPETVAQRLREYADLGVDGFVLSGYPHLEESIRFAELVFPLLGKRPVTSSDVFTGGPFDTGTVVAAESGAAAIEEVRS